MPHDSDAAQKRPLPVEDEHYLPLAVQHIIVPIHDFHLTHMPQKAFVFRLQRDNAYHIENIAES